MERLTDLVLELCNTPGTPGDEQAAFAVAQRALSFCKWVESDPLCGVHGFLGREDAPVQIVLDAHIDQIGMVVTEIDEQGFLHLTTVGGIDRRTLPGARVTVYGKEPIQGVVCVLPEGSGDIASVQEQAVDIGCTKAQAQAQVAVGDRVILTNPVSRLLGTRVGGTALDDRAGCGAIIRAAELLQGADLSCGVHIVCSTQEEVGGTGARLYTHRIAPTHAIAVDVSFAKQAGCDTPGLGELGKGPMIGFSAILDRAMSKKLVEVAKKRGIPYQVEAMGGHTGTNCDGMVDQLRGVKCGLLSIPQRNMHTPSEICDMQDIENVAQLLAAFVLEKGWL